MNIMETNEPKEKLNFLEEIIEEFRPVSRPNRTAICT